MSERADDTGFEPTLAAAQARVDAVRLATYARTRNSIDGDVTRLSPYLTHGLLTLPAVAQALRARGPLPVQHKLIQEFGWREFFHHVWWHEGEGILASLHPGPLPDTAYARELPADIRRACTGVPVIDAAVRALYATGWLHNHARLWLASYVVHLRRVHWRVGADWLYGHLLDGDLASNHLSWQWVAGTGSHKPYLFNADNVARHAPPAWHSGGSIIDTDYATLERIANGGALPPARPVRSSFEPVVEPALLDAPPAGLGLTPTAADRDVVRGREVQLVHPWALGPVPEGRLRVGVIDLAFHRRWPWSAARWAFVMPRWREACDLLWRGTPAELAAALAHAGAVRGASNPHLCAPLTALGLAPAPCLVPWPAQRAHSFSQFWRQATRGLSDVAELG